MSNIIMPENPRKEGFEPCPDPWAKLHLFYNPKTGQTLPARCKSWSCLPCALVNYYKIDSLINLGEPQRFITLSRAGKTPKEISLNLQHLVQGIRRLGKKFEYVAVPELHLNGEPHLHLMQRGDFIEQALLSEMWEKYTAKSYAGKGSFIVDIRFIHDKQNVKGYLLKYIRKSWLSDSIDEKSWAMLQTKYPGLNHYRMSRNWLPKGLEKPEKWQIIPKVLQEPIKANNGPLYPVIDAFFSEPPLTPSQALMLKAGPSRQGSL